MPSRKKAENTKAQRERFIEAAHRAQASEDEAAFDEMLRRITKAKPGPRDQTED